MQRAIICTLSSRRQDAAQVSQAQAQWLQAWMQDSYMEAFMFVLLRGVMDRNGCENHSLPVDFAPSEEVSAEETNGPQQNGRGRAIQCLRPGAILLVRMLGYKARIIA
ncbi:hypothetical protein GCM10027398_09610 [Azotobacter salinestris]